MANVWDDPQKVELLKKLWSEGMSGADCAVRIGGITRNAAIGKIHRLGLATVVGRRSNRPHPSRKPRAPRLLRNPTIARKARVAMVLETAPLPTDRPDDIARKSLIDLEDGDCRFPVGDVRSPGFGFCALPKVEGLPYCSCHCAVAYVSPPVRTRQPAPEKVNA